MKLTSGQEYFRQLTDQFNKELYKESDGEINKILVTQKEDRDELLNEIARIILSFTVVDTVLKLSSTDKFKLNKKLNNSINNIFSNEAKTEIEITEYILTSAISNKYYSNSYILHLGLNFNLKKVNDNTLSRIIKKTIKGKNYSNRIWDNKNQVAKTLKVEIYKFLNGEINVNEIEKVIKARFNSNAYNTKRLVNTEVARVMEEVNNKWQEEYDIEYVIYSATLDSLTCNDCGEYDGQVFKVNEKPVKLPKHPNCRCTYISLPDKNYKPKTRRDNEKQEVVNWTSYKEWKNKNNI